MNHNKWHTKYTLVCDGNNAWKVKKTFLFVFSQTMNTISYQFSCFSDCTLGGDKWNTKEAALNAFYKYIEDEIKDKEYANNEFVITHKELL